MFHTQLILFAQRFQKFYTRQFAALLAETGLSMREIHVVLFLANHPRYDTARAVTEVRGLAKSQVSQAVDLLAARGLLRRTPDTADRRVIHLSITDQGMPLVRRAQGIQSACGDKLLGCLTREEADEFNRLMEKVFVGSESLMEQEAAE